MQFLISDTFTTSLAKLTGDEQKAVKTTAFDLQIDPMNTGMSFHKLDRAKDKNFWSVRVSSDIRLIVHRTSESLLLCYVDHHDKAYDWAGRRKLETHSSTGAAQLVEIRETTREVVVPIYVQPPAPEMVYKPRLANIADSELLEFGIPLEWLAELKAADDDQLLVLADHLPAEAAEAVIELATGGKPKKPMFESAPTNPFDHPDAQRRFRLVANADELAQALDYPWDRWMVFLHPDQREFVTRDQSGPARVSGSAGTGKTVVALHRAVHLAKQNPEARVLMTSFSETLANDLDARLKRLVRSEPKLAERIDVYSINAIGLRLFQKLIGTPAIADSDTIDNLLVNASPLFPAHKFSTQFLRTEWDQVVDAWQLKNWEEYRDVARIGRKTRLPEVQRQGLWAIFEDVRQKLLDKDLLTYAGLFYNLQHAVERAKHPPFQFAVIDEAQDLAVSHLRFFAALGGGRSNALFFAGDLGQRIFQQPFSWKSCGVDIRGRSKTLRINYRTSHQIRTQADRLLGVEVADIDGNVEVRGETISAFNGPSPVVGTFKSERAELDGVAEWINERIAEGVQPAEIAIVVRSEEQLERASMAIELSSVASPVHIFTMHQAKGLEFRAVAVIACDDEIIPLQGRVESVADSADLQEVYDTERHLLYVACTRARDFLWVSGVEPASEFLEDLRSPDTKGESRR
jgi:hypothetical protein